MRRSLALALVLAAAPAAAQETIPLLNYVSVDGGGILGPYSPLYDSETCAVLNLGGLTPGPDGGSFFLALQQVDPLNPSVPVGPQEDAGPFSSPTDAGVVICYNTNQGGTSAATVSWTVQGQAPIWTGVTLSVANTDTVLPFPSSTPFLDAGTVEAASFACNPANASCLPAVTSQTVGFLDAGSIEVAGCFSLASGGIGFCNGATITDPSGGGVVITPVDGGVVTVAGPLSVSGAAAFNGNFSWQNGVSGNGALDTYSYCYITGGNCLASGPTWALNGNFSVAPATIAPPTAYTNVLPDPWMQSAASWTGTGATFTPNTGLAPNGMGLESSSGSGTLTTTAAGDWLYNTPDIASSGSAYTFSIYAYAGSSLPGALYCYDTTSSAFVLSKAVTIGTSWQRFSGTTSTITSLQNFHCGISPSTSAAATAYVWGAQLETGSTANPLIATGSGHTGGYTDTLPMVSMLDAQIDNLSAGQMYVPGRPLDAIYYSNPYWVFGRACSGGDCPDVALFGSTLWSEGAVASLSNSTSGNWLYSGGQSISSNVTVLCYSSGTGATQNIFFTANGLTAVISQTDCENGEWINFYDAAGTAASSPDTISISGGTIDGLSSITLNKNYGSVQVMMNGGNGFTNRAGATFDSSVQVGTLGNASTSAPLTTNGSGLNYADGGGWEACAANSGNCATMSSPGDGTGAIFGSEAGPANLVAISQLDTSHFTFPTGVTVTPHGTTGSTAYFYCVTAYYEGIGETPCYATGVAANGNATLSGTNYNTIAWTNAPGAISENVYLCGDDPECLQGQRVCSGVSSGTCNDTGATLGVEPPHAFVSDVGGIVQDVNACNAVAWNNYCPGGSNVIENSALYPNGGSELVYGPLDDFGEYLASVNPQGPSCTYTGAAGSTTYTYEAECYAGGDLTWFPTGATSTCSCTSAASSLSTSNYCTVAFVPPPGSICRLARTAGGGSQGWLNGFDANSPCSGPYIGGSPTTSTCPSGRVQSWRDNGSPSVTGPASPSASNLTGTAVLGGPSPKVRLRATTTGRLDVLDPNASNLPGCIGLDAGVDCGPGTIAAPTFASWAACLGTVTNVVVTGNDQAGVVTFETGTASSCNGGTHLVTLLFGATQASVPWAASVSSPSVGTGAGGSAANASTLLTGTAPALYANGEGTLGLYPTSPATFTPASTTYYAISWNLPSVK